MCSSDLFKENKVFHCEGEGPPLGCLYYYIMSISLSFSERSTLRMVLFSRGEYVTYLLQLMYLHMVKQSYVNVILTIIVKIRLKTKRILDKDPWYSLFT